MQLHHVHISTGNAKLGTQIPSVNLPAITTCIKDAPCAGKCYARRGRMAFAKVKQKAETNLLLWQNEPDMFERDVKIAAFPSRFFRWHCSGDIPDAEYLVMMARTATDLPDMKFLAFTKKFALVNAYLDQQGPLPCNLIVVFSAWGDWLPENPHGLPEAHILFNGQYQTMQDGSILCPRYCGDCVRMEDNCWSMKKGGMVYFREH